MSATRPSQPVVEARVGRPVCQDDCWSEWENRPSGVWTVRFLYWVSVVGQASVPTLATMAQRPASNSGRIGASAGLRPSCGPVKPLSDSGSSVACGSAIAGRALR